MEVGKNYIIRAPYSRGQYEGQAFDGEVEFLGTEPDANGKSMFRFLYIKKPEHQEEVGGGSTYVCQEESLKYILEKKTAPKFGAVLAIKVQDTIQKIF